MPRTQPFVFSALRQDGWPVGYNVNVKVVAGWVRDSNIEPDKNSLDAMQRISHAFCM